MPHRAEKRAQLLVGRFFVLWALFAPARNGSRQKQIFRSPTSLDDWRSPVPSVSFFPDLRSSVHASPCQMEQHLPTFLPTRRGLRQQNLPTYLPACLQLDAKTTDLPTYLPIPGVPRSDRVNTKVAQLDIRLQNGLKIVGGHLKPARKSTFCTQKGQNFLRAARRPKIATCSRHGSCRQKLLTFLR